MSFLSPKNKSPNTSPRNSDHGGAKKSFFSSSSPTAAEQERASHFPPIGPGQLSINVISADSLVNTRMIGHIDPFIQVTIGNKQAKSPSINNTSAPEWNFSEIFDLEGNETMAVFEVFHQGFVTHSSIGRQEIPLIDLIQPPDNKSFRLFRGRNMEDQAGVIHMTMKWLPSSRSGIGLGGASSVVQSSYEQVPIIETAPVTVQPIADSAAVQPVGTGAAVASVAALPVHSAVVESSVQRTSSYHSATDAKAPLTASSTHSGVYEAAFTQPVSQVSPPSVSTASTSATRLPLAEVGPAPTTIFAETAVVSTFPVGKVITVPTTITTIPAELIQPLPTFTSPPWKQAADTTSSSSSYGHSTQRQLSQSSSSGLGQADKDRDYMAKGEGALASSSSKHSLSSSSGSDDALTTTETRTEFQRSSSSSEMV